MQPVVAFSPGPEWIVVLVVLVLLFGAKKLPELFRSLGRSSSEFKRGMQEGAVEADEAGSTEPKAEERAEPRAENSSE